MSLSTKTVQISAPKASPLIKPGNHVLKINSISLEKPLYQHDGLQYFLVLDVETQPVQDPNFTGFKDPNGRPYQGQIGKIKYNRYAFKDGVLPNGIEITLVGTLLESVVRLATALGQRELVDSIDEDTIENLIKSVSAALCPTAYMSFCVAGKEYENKQGYTNYDLFLPKGSKDGYAFGPVNSEKVAVFNEEAHIIKSERKEQAIDGFSGTLDAY